MAILVAKTRLEELQLRKLLDCIRNKDSSIFNKLVANGLPNLVNYIEDSPEGIGKSLGKKIRFFSGVESQPLCL